MLREFAANEESRVGCEPEGEHTTCERVRTLVRLVTTAKQEGQTRHSGSDEPCSGRRPARAGHQRLTSVRALRACALRHLPLVSSRDGKSRSNDLVCSIAPPRGNESLVRGRAALIDAATGPSACRSRPRHVQPSSSAQLQRSYCSDLARSKQQHS